MFLTFWQIVTSLGSLFLNPYDFKYGHSSFSFKIDCRDLGGKYLVFGSSCSVKMREADQKRLERSL
jgi:hypothetical protein